jgi:hypothetical protein
VQDGDDIHVLVFNAGGITYHRFNCSTDNWDETETTVLSSPVDTPFRSFGSTRINDSGEIICAYQGETERIHGGDKERVYAAYRDGSPPSWTTGVALDAGGDIHYMNPVGVNSPEPTDNVHIKWFRETNTADPPVSNLDERARTLRANKTLDAVFSGSRDTNEAVLGVQNAVSWRDDVSSPRRLELLWMGVNRDPSTSFVEKMQGAESISDNDLGTIGGGGSDSTIEPYSDNIFDMGILSCAVWPKAGIATSDQWIIFSGGGTTGADQDLYVAGSEDDGATFDSPTVRLVLTGTVENVAATVYERDNKVVLAFLMEEGTNQYYGEIAIKKLHRNAALLTPPEKIGARIF